MTGRGLLEHNTLSTSGSTKNISREYTVTECTSPDCEWGYVLGTQN